MGTQLTVLPALAAGVLLGACAGVTAGTDVPGEALGGYRVAIENAGEVCALQVRRERADRVMTVTLSLTPPCHFVRDWQGNIQSYRYADLGPAQVVAVVGTPVPEGQLPEALRGRGDCGGQLQAVLVRADAVDAVATVHDTVRCADSGLDERVFWSLSHPAPTVPVVDGNAE